jgi:hypothetical protein
VGRVGNLLCGRATYLNVSIQIANKLGNVKRNLITAVATAHTEYNSYLLVSLINSAVGKGKPTEEFHVEAFFIITKNALCVGHICLSHIDLVSGTGTD